MITTQTRVQSWIGFAVSPVLVDDVLIDAGPTHVGRVLVPWLADQEIRAVAITHHHEDHAGNAASIANPRGVPIYLARPDLRDSEGTGALLAYRRLFWGWPERCAPLPMPAEIPTRGRVLVAIPTPGHCATHTAFYDPESGLLFSGDLLTALGVSAVMRYEEPETLVRSLRTAAAVGPRVLVTGHGIFHERATDRLLSKADRVEAAIARVRTLHQEGRSRREILRDLFRRGHAQDAWMSLLTAGEFSRARFVDAVLRATPSPAAPPPPPP